MDCIISSPGYKSGLTFSLAYREQTVGLFSICNYESSFSQEINSGGHSQDGGGIGRGDYLLPLKFIKSSFECWAAFTKQLNAGRGHQAPRKAAHSLWKEVGQNIKDKRDKRVRDGDPSWGRSCEGGEVSKPYETLSHTGLWGVLESQRAT